MHHGRETLLIFESNINPGHRSGWPICYILLHEARMLNDKPMLIDWSSLIC